MSGRFDPTGPWPTTTRDEPFAEVDGETLLARITEPTGDGAPTARRPALVSVHGGAWTYFDRTVNGRLDAGIAACGAVVVSVDFRQAPVHRWHAAAADVAAGVRWVKHHAARLGIDDGDVAIFGGSSGGHLAAWIAAQPWAPENAGTPILDTDGHLVDAASADALDPSVAYALPLWPIAAPDLRYAYLAERKRTGRTASKEPMFDLDRLLAAHEAFFGDEATMRAASVQHRCEAGAVGELPPIWIAQPELDENVTEEMTEAFAEAWRAAGGTAEVEVFAGVGHSFANFPVPEADTAIERMRAFVAARLAAGDHCPSPPAILEPR